nr:hypothetical protein [Tanacetum cinerariifolium]
MVAILEKSDAAEGFEQIFDFLSGSYINHALTVNPHVYISCIKQFWNTAVVKRSGDVTRLQAIVDKKRIVITEEVVCEILQLNDAEGQRFNFSNYIFESLVRNVDSSSKFYMYPRFIQLIIQTNIADLSKHTTRYISPTLTQKVFANMRRVRKGFSGVETPLFESMLVARDVVKEAEAQVPAQGDDVQEPTVEEVVTDVVPPTTTPPSPPSPVLDTCFILARRVEGLEHDKAAQQLEIGKLKARVKKLEKINKVKSSKLRRLKKVGTSQRVESSDDMENVLSMQEDDTKVQEAVEIVTTAKLMTEELSSDTPAETPKVKAKGKGILIEAPKPMKKKDQIEIDAEYARKLQEEINKEHEESFKNIDWNAALDHIQSKEPQYIKRYHGMKKKPQTESEACKNMILYLKNTKGYKMDFFKGMKYDEILPIFQAKFDANIIFLYKSREEIEAKDEEIIKSINETPAQKAAKRRKLYEQAKEDEDLKKQLEVVKDEDDDVFIEATLIGRKVPIVDYEIVMINTKPREDLEDLWRIVKARFSTSKPTNFSNDYLLSTLKTMFKKTDGQDAIWRNQQSVYGQALVKS